MKLDVTEEAARKRVDRALEKLRALLVGRGVASTAGAVAAMLANQTVIAAPAGFAATVTGSALASGTVAATPLLNFLQFMNASKITAGVAAIVIALTIGTATHEILARRNAETALAVANRDYDALIATRFELEQRVRVAQQEIAQLRGRLKRPVILSAAKNPRDRPPSQPWIFRRAQNDKKRGLSDFLDAL